MSVENVKRFYEDIEKDKSLNEKVVKMRGDFNLSENPSDDELISTTVAIAERLGYHFSVDELKEHFSSIELSDDELESASGGILPAIVVGVAIAGGAVLAKHLADKERKKNKQ